MAGVALRAAPAGDAVGALLAAHVGLAGLDPGRHRWPSPAARSACSEPCTPPTRASACLRATAATAAADRDVAGAVRSPRRPRARGTRSSASAIRWCSAFAGPTRSSSSTPIGVGVAATTCVRRDVRSAARPRRRDRRRPGRSGRRRTRRGHDVGHDRDTRRGQGPHQRELPPHRAQHRADRDPRDRRRARELVHERPDLAVPRHRARAQRSRSAARRTSTPPISHIFDELQHQGGRRRDGHLQLPPRAARSSAAATCRSLRRPPSTTTVSTPAPS